MCSAGPFSTPGGDPPAMRWECSRAQPVWPPSQTQEGKKRSRGEIPSPETGSPAPSLLRHGTSLTWTFSPWPGALQRTMPCAATGLPLWSPRSSPSASPSGQHACSPPSLTPASHPPAQGLRHDFLPAWMPRSSVLRLRALHSARILPEVPSKVHLGLIQIPLHPGIPDRAEAFPHPLCSPKSPAKPQMQRQAQSQKCLGRDRLQRKEGTAAGTQGWGVRGQQARHRGRGRLGKLIQALSLVLVLEGPGKHRDSCNLQVS